MIQQAPIETVAPADHARAHYARPVHDPSESDGRADRVHARPLHALPEGVTEKCSAVWLRLIAGAQDQRDGTAVYFGTAAAIASAIGRSQGTVQYHLAALERLHLIRRPSRSSTGIVVSDSRWLTTSAARDAINPTEQQNPAASQPEREATAKKLSAVDATGTTNDGAAAIAAALHLMVTEPEHRDLYRLALRQLLASDTPSHPEVVDLAAESGRAGQSGPATGTTKPANDSANTLAESANGVAVPATHIQFQSDQSSDRKESCLTELKGPREHRDPVRGESRTAKELAELCSAAISVDRAGGNLNAGINRSCIADFDPYTDQEIRYASLQCAALVEAQKADSAVGLLIAAARRHDTDIFSNVGNETVSETIINKSSRVRVELDHTSTPHCDQGQELASEPTSGREAFVGQGAQRSEADSELVAFSNLDPEIQQLFEQRARDTAEQLGRTTRPAVIRGQAANLWAATHTEKGSTATQ